MLCLNMIVKNEEKIILRLLESVINYIDYYCICDTGSTDNTKQIIKDYFSNNGIDGLLFDESFVDFEYNRNIAFQRACSLPVTHILFIDADMIFESSISVSDFKEKYVNKDACYIYQGSLKCNYKNVRIVRANTEYKYIGVTHEYFDTCNTSNTYDFIESEVIINDVGDGGSKTNKFQRDIQLLSDGLKNAPNNSRYVFYLANSYKDNGDYDNAANYYQRRIDMGGWIQELWCSYYYMAQCYYHMNKKDVAIFYWLKGIQIYNERIENIYHLIKHYRSECSYELAYNFYLLAKRLVNGKPLTGHLFLEKDVYLYKLDYEMTIIGYYVNATSKVNKLYRELLSLDFVEMEYQHSLFDNYIFYTKTLSKEYTTQTINCPSIAGFYPSSPSFVMKNGEDSQPCDDILFMNIRYVNYKIRSDGSYEYNGVIQTKNIIMDYHYDTNITNNTHESDYNATTDNNLYKGIEDVRLLSIDDKIYYSSNVGMADGVIKIQIGSYDYNNNKYSGNMVDSPMNRKCEKNWVLYNTKDGLNIIYQWYPLITGSLFSLNDKTVFVKQDIDYDVGNHKYHYLSGLRGSTNGIYINNHWWFIAHKVHLHTNQKRYYYHILLRMDKNYNIRYSDYFTFEGHPIEYCLGFDYSHSSKSFYIGYSVNDNISKIMKIPYLSLEKIVV